MAAQAKLTDFSVDKVKDRVTAVLKDLNRQATVADILARSGLPKVQVETVLPAVVDECRGQLRVTESGEILYVFPEGLSNRKRGFWPSFKRLSRAALHVTGKVLSFLFKIWIVVMLVGYFALFVALIVLMALALFAAQSAGKDRDRGSSDRGGGFGLGLAFRLLQQLMYFWIITADPAKPRKTDRPYFKAVFAFVFGEGDTEQAWAEAQRRAVLAAIQRQKGVVSREELRAWTGLDQTEAEAYLSRLCLEFEGEPRVSDGGAIYYWFPELLRTNLGASSEPLPGDRPLIPFTRNPKKTNGWIGFFNGFNLLLGAYFLGFGLTGAWQSVEWGLLYYFTALLTSELLGLVDPVLGINMVLGWVPTVFSALFFGIPLVRRWRDSGKNRRIAAANRRRDLMQRCWAQPLAVQPAGPGEEKEFKQLVGAEEVKVEAQGPSFVFQVPEWDRAKKELARVRASVDLSKYKLGATIFDSGA